MTPGTAGRIPPLTAHTPRSVSPPLGGYSHGVEVAAGSRMLFVSGQVPERPDGTVPEGFEAQCEAAWRNVLAVLAEAGMGIGDLVKVTTYLTHADQVDANGRIRRMILGEARPALTVMIAQTLQSSWLLEIEAVAAAAPRTS